MMLRKPVYHATLVCFLINIFEDMIAIIFFLSYVDCNENRVNETLHELKVVQGFWSDLLRCLVAEVHCLRLANISVSRPRHVSL